MYKETCIKEYTHYPYKMGFQKNKISYYIYLKTFGIQAKEEL